ncbi:MAG: hypothetical protein Q9165_008059 [Trypethelium subeluteriae]
MVLSGLDHHRLVPLLFIAAIFLSFCLFTFDFTSNTPRPFPFLGSSGGHHDHVSSSNTTSEKIAYATFLSGSNDGKENLDNKYYVAVRMLGYQLMHCPETRTKRKIPFLVIVTDDVPEIRRKRLEADGAQVIPVESVPMPSWMKPLETRWSVVVTKFRLWQLTDYSRIMFLDGDTVLRENIDDIFDLESTQWQHTLATKGQQTSTELRRPSEKREILNMEELLEADFNATTLPPEPDEYLLAGNADMELHHETPARVPADFINGNLNWINGGFFMLGPSQAMFEYYVTLSHIPHSTAGDCPEQQVMSVAHKPASEGGRMPWKFVGVEWNALYANPRDAGLEDVKGTKTLHLKWWLPAERKDNLTFVEVFWSWRYRMQGFYESYDTERGISF